jgi:hypothetical protein
MPRNQSAIGIASVILFVVSVIGILIIMLVSARNLSATDSANNIEQFYILIGLIYFFILCALIGAVLGLVGWFQTGVSKRWAKMGLILNSLFVTAILLFVIIGALVSPALPNTFN